MSRTSYRLLAAVINKWIENESLRALLFVEIGNVLKQQCPTFREHKWYEARETDAQRTKRIRAEHGLV